jgi:purine-binding chemotaxis protein CheW
MTNAVAQQPVTSTITDVGQQLAGKYLTFRLADEEYGLEILKVQEIIQMQAVTKVPRTPDHMRGVINLRGKVIPVIDLRKKFNMDSSKDTDKTCIIVVQVTSGNSKVVMGTIIDEVKEVLNIKSENIEETPSFGTNINTDFILGIGKVGSTVKILLDINKVLSMDEIASMTKIMQSTAQPQ